MAPKKGGGGGDDDVKREKPLQAVVLADSFTSTFRPISLEQPKVTIVRGF
jgi:translation initiation factor eIF-2B subunit epsilon